MHGEVGDVPAGDGDHQLEELAEVFVARVGQFELLVEVAGVGLDVACFVDHLGGAVVLGFGPRDLLDELGGGQQRALLAVRSEEHTSELQSLMRISYAVFCLKKKKKQRDNQKIKRETPILGSD